MENEETTFFLVFNNLVSECFLGGLLSDLEKRALTIIERSKMENEETTFFLVFNNLLCERLLGGLLSDLEKRGLTIIGMNYSNVDKKFAERHFKRPRRIPPNETIIPWDKAGNFSLDRGFWIEYLTEAPAVALLLKGKNAVKQAYWYTLRERKTTFQTSWGVYSSPTVEIAREDAEFWFRDDCEKWSKRYNKKFMLFVYRKSLRGQVKSFRLKDFRDDYWRTQYYLDSLSVVLIRPIAFQKGLVGDIIDALQINTAALRGLKLVSVNDLRSIPQYADFVDSPSSSSSSSETVDEDGGGFFGAAMVVNYLKTERISVTNDRVNHFKFDPETRLLEIGRDLVYISEPGESAWNLMDKCFPFGFVILPHRQHEPILEASMAGL